MPQRRPRGSRAEHSRSIAVRILHPSRGVAVAAYERFARNAAVDVAHSRARIGDENSH
jgi:hypothetical protein